MPLDNDGIRRLLLELSTVQGVDGNIFWRAFDQCNCGKYFMKAFLNRVHGPLCPTWPYEDTPAPLEAWASSRFSFTQNQNTCSSVKRLNCRIHTFSHSLFLFTFRSRGTIERLNCRTYTILHLLSLLLSLSAHRYLSPLMTRLLRTKGVIRARLYK